MMSDFSYTNTFMEQHASYLLETMMGPNAMRVTEELTAHLNIPKGCRILDLGCGMGLSSLLLADKYEATVFAADLWISPTDNLQRFQQFGMEDRIIPLSADATKGLPFAHHFFDGIISVDAYHYFGTNPTMLPSLLPFLKPGGIIAVAVPGLQAEFPNGVPAELLPHWPGDTYFHSLDWWKDLWSGVEGFSLGACREMDCHQQAWGEWLESSNPYAVEDRDMMVAEGGRYYNHVQMVGSRIEQG